MSLDAERLTDVARRTARSPLVALNPEALAAVVQNQYEDQFSRFVVTLPALHDPACGQLLEDIARGLRVKLENLEWWRAGLAWTARYHYAEDPDGLAAYATLLGVSPATLKYKAAVFARYCPALTGLRLSLLLKPPASAEDNLTRHLAFGFDGQHNPDLDQIVPGLSFESHKRIGDHFLDPVERLAWLKRCHHEGWTLAELSDQLATHAAAQTEAPHVAPARAWAARQVSQLTGRTLPEVRVFCATLVDRLVDDGHEDALFAHVLRHQDRFDAYRATFGPARQNRN
jgi:hypothetical protein